MASRTTLNAKNLAALGAERLAELLIDISTGNAAAKAKLRLALAEEQGPADLAREVSKRLTSIARARTFVTWKNRKKLVDDLETQRRAIVERIAPSDPDAALELSWRFLALANPVFERCDDSSGTVIGIFHTALRDLAEIVTLAAPDPHGLAGNVFAAVQANDFGQFDGLITLLAPALGESGLSLLQNDVEELGRIPVAAPSAGKRRVVGYGMDGPIYADEIQERMRQGMVRMALRDIADARKDPDGFIAQYDPETRTVPVIAAEIATRLIDAGRPEEALRYLDGAEVSHGANVRAEWLLARLEALEALGRGDEAQALRWQTFESELAVDLLRSYLKKLPDFEDIETEQRAMDIAAAYPHFAIALRFFTVWPAPDRAAALILARRDEIDGDRYEILTPAAEALAERYPLAATVALRAMIDFTLEEGRSSRYGHAARHLAACADLAEQIETFDDVESHDAYVARLKKDHGRKRGFWARTASS